MTTAYTSLLVTLLLLASQMPAGAQQPDDRAAWNALFDRTATTYKIYRDQERTAPLLLRPEPAYKWKAASADDNSYGSVYVWTYRGCPEAVVCLWRSGYTIVHEAHGLSPEVLHPLRTGPSLWRPTGGLARQLLAPAPQPAKKAPTRLAQMRQLGEAFTAHTEAHNGERRELRLLNAPLYRYESSDLEVLDGALFAFVCSVGTDPEAFLVLEARKTGSGPRWHYALARFSHLNLFASFNGERVWECLRGDNENAEHTYYIAYGSPSASPELRKAEE